MRIAEEQLYRLTNPNVETPAILDFGNQLELLKTIPLDRIPAGFYHPYYNDETEAVTLKKAELYQDSIEGNDDSLFMRHLELLLGSKESKEADKTRKEAVKFGQFDRGYFEMEKYNTGFGQVHASIDLFLESRDNYMQKDFGYRHSVFVFGEKGIGKTRFINHMAAQMVINQDAIVLILEDTREINGMARNGFTEFLKVTKNRLKVILIPDMYPLTSYSGDAGSINAIFSHPGLRDDVIFLIAAAETQDIPAYFFVNHSTLDVIVDCGVENYTKDFKKAWYTHLMGEEMPESWQTLPFYDTQMTAAMLKELYAITRFHKIDISDAWEIIQNRRKLIDERFLSQEENIRRQLEGKYR